MIPQYAFAGDFTGLYIIIDPILVLKVMAMIPVEAIVKGVTEVAKHDAGECCTHTSESYHLTYAPP